MSKRNLDKTDIGEMYHLAVSAFDAGFLKVKIDSEHAMELCELALDNNRLTEENARLRHELANLIYMAENNTGREPSLSCFYLAINEANNLLKQLLKDKNNDNS